MRFVGGPMHGLSVPENLLEGWAASTGRVLVPILLINDRLHQYELKKWFYRADRELIDYLCYCGLDEDGALKACREVLPC